MISLLSAQSSVEFLHYVLPSSMVYKFIRSDNVDIIHL